MKQFAYFLGWMWGWSWVAVIVGLLFGFFVGQGTGWLAFFVVLALVAIFGLIAVIWATLAGEFREAKKQCPLCKETIQAEAIRCKHCGADVGQYEKLKQLEARLKAPTEKEQSKVIKELTNLGEIAVPLLIETLEDKHNWVAQIEAAFALAKLRDPRAFWPLVNALKSEDRNVVEMVGEALGDFGDPRAVPYLVDALRDDPSSTGVTSGLMKLNDPSAIPGLVRFLMKVQSTMGEAMACGAILHFGSQSVCALAEVYRIASRPKRHTIATLLNQIGPSAAPALLELLAVDEGGMYSPVVSPLAEIGESVRPSVTKLLVSEDELTRERAQEVIRALDWKKKRADEVQESTS